MKRLFIASAFLLFTTSLLAQKENVTLDDVWRKGTFYARSSRGLNSMQGGKFYTTLQRSKDGPSLEKFAYKSGKSVDVIISAKEIKEKTGKQLAFDTYAFGPNEKLLLLGTDTEPIYRHSSKSFYYVYDLENQTLDSIENRKQQLATFSPTRKQVAYVLDNRLHIKNFGNDMPWKTVSFGKGEDDAFIAGAVDWVYEEEFSFHKGFEWAPDGNTIAYYQSDEREVPLFSMDLFGSKLYPSEYEFKYPKAGEANSKVHIELFDLKTQSSTKIEIPEAYEYIPRIKYSPKGDLIIFTMNRHQDELSLWMIKKGTTEAKLFYREEAPSYIEITDDLQFLSDGSFVYTAEIDGYRHIYHVDSNGEIKRQLTKGNYDITTLYGVDEKSKRVFYQAAEESPLERAIYSIKTDGTGKKKLSTQEGWNTANFSDGFTYYINTYSAVGVPTIETLHKQNGKLIRTLTDNAAIKERLEAYNISTKTFFNFATEEGVSLNGWMIKPQNFDAEKQYPVLMFVYGGPGSQTVKNQYGGANDFWYQTLANKGYIVVSVDNRGTGARGRDFRTSTYQQLGKLEIEDQISAARYLGRQSYVDEDRIGIWGWSYGGYMSSLGITKGKDVFKLAIAVAPVTNWRFYDSIYTERYMRTPQENPGGYDDNSPTTHVGELEGHYLLVHGSADDNVHFQNTTRMISALVDADKQFDLFVYPDKNHGIYGGNTRYHLYTKMTNFITENL
jgi:dipeptidyl-peptidase-4